MRVNIGVSHEGEIIKEYNFLGRGGGRNTVGGHTHRPLAGSGILSPSLQAVISDSRSMEMFSSSHIKLSISCWGMLFPSR